MKRMIGLILAVAVAGVLTIATAASSAPSSPRRGILHLTKECSQYTGAAGSFCTVTASNLDAIPVGTKDVAVDAANADGSLDTDIVFYTRGHNMAFGHVVIAAPPAEVGRVTFSGGTGQFRTFRAKLVLRCPLTGVTCTLDGPYSFGE
jgi:hypothetical protein